MRLNELLEKLFEIQTQIGDVEVEVISLEGEETDLLDLHVKSNALVLIIKD